MSERLSEWEQVATNAVRQTQEVFALLDITINRLERYSEALQDIAQWSEAYPTTIFPEPDLKKARQLLEAGGVTLDSVSAHCMRHVVEGVGKIAKQALKGETDG